MQTASETKAVLEQSAEQSWTHLESRVEGVRRRQRLKFFGTGLCLALAIFVAAFLGFSFADIVFKVSIGTRMLALLSTLAGMAAIFFVYVVRPWTRLGGSVQVARNVEQAFPQLEEQLSTALEYGRSPELRDKTSSPALVGALINQAAERAKPLDFARTIRWKQLGIAALIAFALAIGMSAYAFYNSRLFGITLRRFLQPTAEIGAPTLTEIERVLPGDQDNGRTERPVESSVDVTVELKGHMPDTVTLSVLSGVDEKAKWEDRVVERGEDGKYHTTLRRLLDTTKYKVRAYDTESKEYQIDVFKMPEITDFTVRLEHPQYTGRGLEVFAPGVGDVRALKGTIVHVDVKANTDLTGASIGFKSGQSKVAATIDPNDKRKATLSFPVEKDDQYQISVSNNKASASGSLYLVKALKDNAPQVVIRKPEKDLMVHREQTVQIEISATDDVGVGEIGIFHSLGVDEKKVMVRRLDPASPRTDGKLVWELGNQGLKGGEVISYYAYAIDNDTITGPKMAKSDIHFLTVYDEQEYDSQKNPDKKKPQGTPPAVKQLDKLIDVQKKLLKETFAQARQREAAPKDQALTEPEKQAAQKTGEAQKKLREQVADMIEKVKREMEEGPQAAPTPDGQDGPKPQQSGLGENEIKHMEAAAQKMEGAEKQLKVPDTVSAVRPENEALRHLSETRRLLLSDKEGDPRFKMAMDKQSKKKKQQEQNQDQQDQEQAKQELAEMPKMMDRQKKLERELEELTERKKKNPPPETANQTPEQKQEQEEQRRLQREKQEELNQLAKEAEERARKLEQLAARNPDMQQAAEKMQQAADKLKKAAEEAKQQAEKNLNQAKEQAQQAGKDTKDAQRNLRNALEKQVRQELANLQKDAQELAQRQQDLSEQARQMQNEQNQGQQQSQPQQGQKPEQGQPQQGQPQQQGKPEQGQQQSGQPQQGQPQQGKQPQQGQQGPPQSGSQTAQGQQQSEQRMKAMAGQQRDIKNDLKDLAERLEKVAGRANEKNLAGAPDLEQAKKQAGENSAASEAAQKSAEAMQGNKPQEAQREAAQAAKALEQMARTIQDAAQKTTAGDMKQLAAAMKKLQNLSKEQSDINKELGDKPDAAQLGERQEKIATGAKEVADAAENLETLRQNGRQSSVKEKLEDASRQADAAAKALKGNDASSAKSPADKTDKALTQALAEMERAAGKTLEDKAREAKNIAREARENQEKAAAAAKDIPQTKPEDKLDQAGAANRDEAAAKERAASREARRLDQALEGLQELAKDANPAAADTAREARETTQQAELPKSMDQLAKGIEKIGDPKKAAENKDAPTVSPQEASQKGEKLAQVIKNVEKNLDGYIAEAVNSQLDRLRAMETAAREAAKQAEQLAQDKNEAQKNENNKDPNQKNSPEQKTADKQPGDQKDGQNPDAKNNQNDPNSKTAENKNEGKPNENGKPDEKGKQDPKELAKNLEKEMKRLMPKLDRLEPNAPEAKQMREAMEKLGKAQQEMSQKPDPNGPPSPGPTNTGGSNFKRVAKDLDDVAGGLVNRIERILRAREIRPDEDEDAPKEYRVLVDKYYRALSEDVEEEKR